MRDKLCQRMPLIACEYGIYCTLPVAAIVLNDEAILEDEEDCSAVTDV